MIFIIERKPYPQLTIHSMDGMQVVLNGVGLERLITKLERAGLVQRTPPAAPVASPGDPATDYANEHAGEFAVPIQRAQIARAFNAAVKGNSPY